MARQETTRVEIQSPVLAKNDAQADRNRARFKELGVSVINLISSPGSGKTTLLEAMARELGGKLAVIEGDQQTERDADRVRRAGVKAVQIETGDACHLDAKAVSEAIDELDLENSGVEVVVIENVGNLICPSSYDLGENLKGALLSLPEGDDKVLKYPSVFCRVGVLLITKMDLQPYMDFDVERAIEETSSLNREFETFKISAKTGDGVPEFCDYLVNLSRAS
ncbi:Hydrogenase isoenzymes nickel incorporation protein HypB [Pseudodesulfovibrio hydrargyri]|uniref:Hydrogenase isoenzymes nickel incorporation protein HypB n=1 Tax=Pseudodesulfovibrio hydrargyri TaxID=2125990 RepID=A0A1J5NGS8_9BACT|nr:hydrogenase nickel incorporation protein HypB [Pseudodesulfovibrio hydrargyri]OIQ50905.1 Hydrogenase isoenzymes nickel incorporation protein HypB [Pseudodesulfovibrio hydrargyri]